MNRTHRSGTPISEIYKRHADTVYRVSFLMMKNRQEAEDVTQSVFAGLISQPVAFDSEEHEKAWLIRASRNRCINLLKSSWFKKRAFLPELPETADCRNRDFQDPCVVLSAADLTAKVMSLPLKYRTVLYLYYYEGYKTCEISQMLSVNESTVKTRLRAARYRLKLSFKEDETT